jgi:hypothetical protein
MVYSSLAPEIPLLLTTLDIHPLGSQSSGVRQKEAGADTATLAGIIRASVGRNNYEWSFRLKGMESGGE